jgi:hypothetical protein
MGVLDRKMKDVAGMVTTKQAKNAFCTWMTNYRAKYIETGSFTPIVHTCLLVGGIGYTVEWLYRGGKTIAIILTQLLLKYKTNQPTTSMPNITDQALQIASINTSFTFFNLLHNSRSFQIESRELLGHYQWRI